MYLSIIKKVEPIETNIVIFELESHVDEGEFVQQLTDKDIHIIGMGSNKLRMVTHLDYTDAMHEQLLEILNDFEYCK